jgi:hypothetical protein
MALATWNEPSQKGWPMFTPEQYRAKAAEYTELVKTARNPNEVREFQRLEQSFTVLADNEQWLIDNRDQTVHAEEYGGAGEATLASGAIAMATGT